MGCLFALFAGFFPRFAVLFIWLARPALFNAAIGPLFAILGIIFLPFTTLMYVILWSPAGNIQGLDWLWLALAFIIDISSAGASAYNNRDRVPGYNPDTYRGG
jgi:hypothetical protein